MKILALILCLTVSTTVFAAGGFTWLHSVSEATHLPEHTVTFLFVCMLLLALGILYRVKANPVENALVPDKGISFRNAFEFLGEFVYGLCRNILGEKQAKKYYALIVLYFMLILFNNLIGLVPGFLPPTENFNTTLALGLFVFVYYNYQGVRVQGVWGHIKHFMGPVLPLAPLMLILELISHGARPISLGLRLKGNMEGDHKVLAIFSDLVPYIVPIPFYVVGMFVSFIQAFVFTLLTMVYISLATETHDHEAH